MDRRGSSKPDTCQNTGSDKKSAWVGGLAMMEWLGSKGFWILAVLWFICFGIFRSSTDDRNWRATAFFGGVTVFLLLAIMFLAMGSDAWR